MSRSIIRGYTSSKFLFNREVALVELQNMLQENNIDNHVPLARYSTPYKLSNE